MGDKKKVAILGGGPAGLAAAFGLSATPELRDRYDVTIFQPGWRVGGKCASGRVPPTNHIAQNGTHYLFGCYDNCFDTAKQAFGELEAAGIDWFGTYEEAFLPRDLVAMKQRYRGRWRTWPLFLPTNSTAPTTRQGMLRPVEYVGMALQFLAGLITGGRALHWFGPPSPFGPKRPAWLRAVYAVLRPFWLVFAYILSGLLIGSAKAVVAILRALGDKRLETVVAFFRVSRGLARVSLKPLGSAFLWANRLYLGIDFQSAVMIGVIRDDVLGPDKFGAIEGVEFREWLHLHGADPVTLDAPFVTMWYDSVAAYEQGDLSRPNLSAGVSLMAISKAVLAYKGHFTYQMRAEAGDTFVAPVFQCLRQRGVKVRFFHRVREVVPGPDGEIDRIEVDRQVDLRSGDPDSYEPFEVVRGLHVWPDKPLWEQIVQSEPVAPPGMSPCEADLAANLESFYTTWKPVGCDTLLKGRDFDIAVLAMPSETFREYCPELIEADERWAAMVGNLPGVETQSTRLWFYPSLDEMGWPYGPPVLSAYAQPFSTWEDNGHLVDVETWPAEATPRAIATLFGALPAPAFAPPPDDWAYPCRQNEAARANVLSFLEENTRGLWPGATSRMDPAGIDWATLIDLENGLGSERLKSQGVRANSGPCQRYTMARAATSRFRLATDESGYSNLFLAGDWIQNHFLVGSVEGAVMAGLQASRAISGYPAKIPGEDTGL